MLFCRITAQADSSYPAHPVLLLGLYGGRSDSCVLFPGWGLPQLQLDPAKAAMLERLKGTGAVLAPEYEGGSTGHRHPGRELHDALQAAKASEQSLSSSARLVLRLLYNSEDGVCTRRTY